MPSTLPRRKAAKKGAEKKAADVKEAGEIAAEEKMKGASEAKGEEAGKIAAGEQAEEKKAGAEEEEEENTRTDQADAPGTSAAAIEPPNQNEMVEVGAGKTAGQTPAATSRWNKTVASAEHAETGVGLWGAAAAAATGLAWVDMGAELHATAAAAAAGASVYAAAAEPQRQRDAVQEREASDDEDDTDMAAMFNAFKVQHGSYVETCTKLVGHLARQNKEQEQRGATRTTRARSREATGADQARKRPRKNSVAKMLKQVTEMEREMQKRSKEVLCAMVTPGLEFKYQSEEWMVKQKAADGQCACAPVEDQPGAHRGMTLHALDIAKTISCSFDT